MIVTSIKAGHGVSSTWICFVVVLILTATAVHITALSSPYWEYAENELGSSHSGLWWVCFLRRCDLLTNHQLTGWFKMVQGFMVIATLCHVSAVVALSCYLFHIALDKLEKSFLLLAFICIALAGVLVSSSVCVYGLRQGEPDFSTLSWSYFLALLSAILTNTAAIFLAYEFCRFQPSSKLHDANIVAQKQPSMGCTDALRGRSTSVISVSSTTNGEKRPLNNNAVRMRSYSSSLVSPAFCETRNFQEQRFTFDLKVVPI